MQGLMNRLGAPLLAAIAAIAAASGPVLGAGLSTQQRPGRELAHTVQDGPRMHTVQDHWLPYFPPPPPSPPPWLEDDFGPGDNEVSGPDTGGLTWFYQGGPLSGPIQIAAPEALDVSDVPPALRLGGRPASPLRGFPQLGAPELGRAGLGDAAEFFGRGEQFGGSSPIPSPGALAVLGLAALMAGRRRHR